MQKHESNITQLNNRISNMMALNNKITEANRAYGNLLASTGMSEDQVLGQIANIETNMAARKQEYDRALEKGSLQLELDNTVPQGTDIAGRIGELTGLSDQAQQMYENYGKVKTIEGQIASYRDSQEIQDISQGDAPAPVIQQAVVTTPALKAIATSDPASANALARIDYAISGGQWTPATSQALVNLTNSLNGSKAKDSVQSILQGLVSRMSTAGGVPPAVASAAAMGNPTQVAAAAKFGNAA